MKNIILVILIGISVVGCVSPTPPSIIFAGATSVTVQTCVYSISEQLREVIDESRFPSIQKEADRACELSGKNTAVMLSHSGVYRSGRADCIAINHLFACKNE